MKIKGFPYIFSFVMTVITNENEGFSFINISFVMTNQSKQTDRQTNKQRRQPICCQLYTTRAEWQIF